MVIIFFMTDITPISLDFITLQCYLLAMFSSSMVPRKAFKPSFGQGNPVFLLMYQEQFYLKHQNDLSVINKYRTRSE